MKKTIAKNNLVEYLLNYALEHKINLKVVRLRKDYVSNCIPEERLIVINSSLYNEPYYPFMIAHEIGHIMNGDSGVLYFQAPTAKYSTEHEADLFALDLLYKYSCKKGDVFRSPCQFLQAYGIPFTMLEPAQQLFNQADDLIEK